MSPRVIVFSAVLTALLAGGAVVLLTVEGGGSSGAVGTGGDGGTGDRSGTGRETPTGDPDGGAATDTTTRTSGDGRTGSGAGSPGGVARPPRTVGTDEPDDPERPDATTGGDEIARTDPSGRNPTSSGADGTRTGDRASGGGTSDPDDSAGTITLTGTIAAVDPAGERHEGTSGTLRARVVHPSLDEVRVVSVDGGEFRLSTPEGATLRFLDAMLDDRSADVSPPEVRGVRAGTRLALVATWASRTVLHVRSRETGEDLCDLTMLRIGDWNRNSRPHPGVILETDPTETVECSPFRLDRDGPGAGSSVPYHVHAPGHAWGRILLDTAAGGDRELLLDPGGDIDLVLVGGWNRPGALLRLRELGRPQPYAEVAVSGPALMLRGIHPGTYELSIETGSWAQDPLVFGSTEVLVEAGMLLPLELAVDEYEEEERVPLAGTVFVPTGWALDEFTVQIRPVGPGSNYQTETQHVPSLEMSAAPIGGGMLYGWEADPVKTGTYSILVLPVGVGVNATVGPEGNLQANIELAPAVPVEVVTVLQGTEIAADPSFIRWTPTRGPGVLGAGAQSVQPEPGGGLFLFDAPLGGIVVSCSDLRFRPTSEQVTLTADGPNLITLELEPAHGITVLLFDGDTAVPWDLGWHATLTAALGTDGTVVSRGRVGIGYRILVSTPGNYALSIPPIDGFLPVAPIPVTIAEGEILDVEVGLERVP